MAYVSKWEPLSVARACVMAATGLSKTEVESDICRAILDRDVEFRCKLKEHLTKHITASAVLEGENFDIPEIKPEDLDWEQSRPLKPWAVLHGAFNPAGYWHLESIELYRIDLTNALCPSEHSRKPVEYAKSGPGATSRPALESNTTGHARKSYAPQSPGARRPARRRGAPPTKFQRVSSAMRGDLRQGRRTVPELKNMLEKNLASTYGVSRDTARKARNAVLSEFGEN